MEIGMLWLDDDKKLTLDEKINRAADYYQRKYGQTPDICLVNSAALKVEKKVGRIKVKPVGHVLPHHFWVGVNTN